MAERLPIRNIQPPTETEQFVPHMVKLDIPGVVIGYISVVPLVIESTGRAGVPNAKNLLEQVSDPESPLSTSLSAHGTAVLDEARTSLTVFPERVRDEVQRSLRGTQVPRDQSQIAQGMSYDEIDKIPSPITPEAIEARRNAARAIIEEAGQRNGVTSEVREALRASGASYISEDQRQGYIDTMRRTNKYEMTPPEDGEYPYQHDELGRNVLQVKTSKRPFWGYGLFAKPYFPEELQKMGDILGTVTTLTTEDNYLLLIKRSDENVRYKGPGLFGGLFDDQGIPLSNEAVSRNNSEEVYQELGIHPSHLYDRQVTAILFDNIAPHGEITERARVRLTAAELVPIIDANAKKAEARLNEPREADYFFIPKNSENLRKLLVDVRCPLPPTHTGALIGDADVAYFQEQLQATNSMRRAYEATLQFHQALVAGIQENYQEINRIARDHWQNNPGAWEEFVRKDREEALSRGKRPLDRSVMPERWDPSIPDDVQGLSSLREQLLAHTITTPTMLHGARLRQ